MANSRRLIFCLAGALALAVATVAQASMKEAVSELRQALDACTASSGYDPAKAAGLGDYTLHPGERAWAACAYGALRSHMEPRSKIPEAYEQLIRRHRELTAGIEAKQVTRSQRRTELEALILAVQNQEEALERGEEKAASTLMDEARRQREIRDLQRRLDDITRSLREARRLTD